MTNLEYKRDDYEHQKTVTEELQDYIEDFEYRATDEDIKDNITSYRFSIPKSYYKNVKRFCIDHKMTMSELFKISLKEYGMLIEYPKNIPIIPKEKSQQLKIFVSEEENYYIGLQVKTSGMTKNEYITEAFKKRIKRTKKLTQKNMFRICKDQIKAIDEQL